LAIKLTVDVSNKYCFRSGQPTSIYFRIHIVGRSDGGLPIIRPAIIMLIDASGSMAGDKIEAAKDASIAALKIVPDKAYISLYTFSHNVRHVGKCESLNEICRNNLADAVASLRAYGGTPLYTALRNALREFRGLMKPNTSLKLFLLTDGQPTDVREEREYYELAKDFNELNVELNIFGVGEDYNEELLANMLEYCNGFLEHIKHPNEVPQLFSKYSIKAANIVAKDVKLYLTASPEDIVEVFSDRIQQTESGFIVDLGDISQGEERKIFGRIIVSPRNIEGLYKIAEVRAVSGDTVLGEDVINVSFVNDISLIREGSKPEVANEALAVLGLIRGNLGLMKKTMSYIKDESLRKTLKIALEASLAGDKKTLTAIRTKTMRGNVED
jgi:Ca-activated chloride channel family protein